MGVKLKDLVPSIQISFETITGKYLAVDALNAIYQFLAIIRQPDGTPLMNHNQEITSHLSGLFYRTISFLEKQIYPIYVFDGEPPILKKETIATRQEIRKKSKEKWEHALRIGDLESARKYAQAAIEIDEKMINDSKELLIAMGIPIVQAPSEGEAQAAAIVRRGDAWATASQDYDSLLFGSPRLVRNLTLRRKRKVAGKQEYKEISLELIDLEQTLSSLKITLENLIDIAILVGTDFNKGIKGIGPKRAYQLIKKHGNIKKVLSTLELEPTEDLLYEEVKTIFLNPKVTFSYSIDFSYPNADKIKEILCEKHDFSRERVEKGIDRLIATKERKQQTSLDMWL